MLNIPTAPKQGATMREIANDENHANWQKYQDGIKMKGKKP